jgi:hypothetical protein
MLARFTIFLLLVCCSSASQAQWISKNAGLDTARIRAMHFVSATEGILVGDSMRIYRTTDGAESWQPLEPSVCNACIVDYSRVTFFGPLKGFIWGKVRSTGATIVLASTDGGANWEVGDSSIANIRYITETFGYKTLTKDYRNLVLITSDLGKTWRDFFTCQMTWYYDFGEISGRFGDTLNAQIRDFRYSGHAGMSDQSHDDSLYTTDGGKSWGRMILPAPYPIGLGNLRWLGLRNDVVVRSDDGGKNWPVVHVPAYPMAGFIGLGGNVVYAVLKDSNHIARSNDAGSSWSLEFVADSMKVIRNMQRFVVGSTETIYLLASNKAREGSWLFKQSNDVSSVKINQRPADLEVLRDGNRLIIANAIDRPVILDLIGRVVGAKAREIDGTWIFDVSSLTAGVYFVSSGMKTCKVIIE